MFSNRTLFEMCKVIQRYSHAEINQIISIFNLTPNIIGEQLTTIAKATRIFNDFRYRTKDLPKLFSDDIQIDLLQFIVDKYFDNHPEHESGDTIIYYGRGPAISFDNAFTVNHAQLANSLKRDGFIIIGREVRKLLPKEIQEAKIESELVHSLDDFKFEQSKGHLVQAIQNHSMGNWAAANAQFRPFIESLMVEISNHLLPGNNAETFAQAIKLLSSTAKPPFFSTDLNEVTNDKDSDSFVQGFWIRLHPEGVHPGLSNEDDCSFRYHISIIVANYFLRRLKERK